jgi:hypothetical protein
MLELILQHSAQRRYEEWIRKKSGTYLEIETATHNLLNAGDLKPWLGSMADKEGAKAVRDLGYQMMKTLVMLGVSRMVRNRGIAEQMMTWGINVDQWRRKHGMGP